MQNTVIDIVVPWILPKQGYNKLNCDGPSNKFSEAGVGWVIRGDDDGFKAFFAKHIYKN